jgi:hypothetical protein
MRSTRVHERYGALRLDLSADPAIYSSDLWAADRLHPSELGLRRLARLVGQLIADEGLEFELPSLTCTSERPRLRERRSRWSPTSPTSPRGSAAESGTLPLGRPVRLSPGRAGRYDPPWPREPLRRLADARISRWTIAGHPLLGIEHRCQVGATTHEDERRVIIVTLAGPPHRHGNHVLACVQATCHRRCSTPLHIRKRDTRARRPHRHGVLVVRVPGLPHQVDPLALAQVGGSVGAPVVVGSTGVRRVQPEVADSWALRIDQSPAMDPPWTGDQIVSRSPASTR